MRYLVCFAFLVLPSICAAQTPIAERCHRALDVLQNTKERAERRSALDIAPRCGAEGARALAVELHRLGSVSDTTELLGSYYRIAAIRDREVLDAALAVAANRNNTVASRIIALKLLVSYGNVRAVSAPLSSFLENGQVSISSQDHFARAEGAPLPAGWRQTVAALLSQLQEDESESAAIRYAAGRAESLFQRSRHSSH